PQGREACRPSSASADQIPAGDQPQNREGARPRSSGNAARARRRGDRMNRRSFIALLGGGAAVTWPLAARAQQGPVLGYFSSQSPNWDAPRLSALRQSLAEAGYVEGSNLGIEYRWAEGDYHRLAAQAEEFVRRAVAVIVAGSLPAALAAKAATT